MKFMKTWAKRHYEKLFFFLIFSLFLSINIASAANTVWVVPSSNVGGSGVTNPENVNTANTAYARFAGNGNYWNWYDYVLSSIPPGSTIDGIEVNARGLRQSGCGTNCLMRLRLSYNNGTSWTSYINTATWTTTNVDHILGGPTNTWGRSWTRDEIANSFRVQALWQVSSGTYYGDLDYLPVRVYYTPNLASSYNLSGYITNQSNGIGLNLAVVQINTTPAPTTAFTNSQGYYNFSGIPNGSYLVSASINGYEPNSTTATINGSNVNNVNISLSPAPTYLISGYVTNASNSVAISDAVVTIDSGLSTLTDITGYYNFTAANGSYTISASAEGYFSKEIEIIINGADVPDSDIALSITPAGGKILVATNRYVVLDDWIGVTSGLLGQGFSSPGTTHSANSWTNVNTRINATALFMDEMGSPVIGRNITFNLYMPNGTEVAAAKINATTDSYGLANFSFNMDGKNFYGNWTVRASNNGFSDNTSFIYNWWGCGTSSCSSHANRDPAGTIVRNSPYLGGRETISQTTTHTSTTLNCTNCHQSFDGMPGGNTLGNPNHTQKTQDVHRNLSCSNTNCHQLSSTHSTNAAIGSCYSTACHRSLGTLANRSDISNKSTLNAAGMSLYSYSNNSNFNNTFHTPDSTVPCIICHGPMHNITKPDESQRFIKNTNTEESQCMICHSSNKKHNATVNCTLCHSDDAHEIKVFSQTAGYVNKGDVYQGNCTNCHQNSSFYTLLKANPKAGNQTGRNPPFIGIELEHSDDHNSGNKYNEYWTPLDQSSACKYCHGLTNHETSGLGKPGSFKGNNTVNSSLGNSTWCISCHYPSSNNYSDMTLTFIDNLLNVPPSFIAGTNYYMGGKDHSTLSSFNDSTCNKCHNGTKNYATITQFMHGVYVGGGGPNCLGCHDVGKNGSVLHVNNSVMNISMHKNLNNQSINSSNVPADNKKCWGCHQSDGSQPSNTSMGDMYTKPYTCYDCHKNEDKPYQNIINATRVTNHIDVDSTITRIFTHNATCTTCHNNSNNLDIAGILDTRNISADEGVSHYGKTSSLVDSINEPQGCIYCHFNASNAEMWGKARDPRLRFPNVHGAVTRNTQCHTCHIQGALPQNFHNESMYYAGNGKILLSTNRIVILDDPKTQANGAKADTASGFGFPSSDWGTSNYWTGKNTKINASALYIDRYGKPITGAAVSFTLYWPNGSALITVNDITNSNGLANFSMDLNAKNYYGQWKIRANNGSVGANTTFIYNWWGCGGGAGCSGHGSENPGSSTGSGNSPYLSGRDSITSNSHHTSSTKCLYCHQSFDGKQRSSTSSTDYTSDVHRNISCDNTNCHGTKATHDSNQLINSCFASTCHNRTDISRKSTLSGAILSTATSIFSSNNGSNVNSTYHTPNSTIPCIICHGPMHGITKTDPNQRFIKNNDTEYTQCIACHQDYVRHNNSVNCPVCHSDDIHKIQVLSQNATYITLNRYDPNPSRGNCNSCHQNSSFFGSLINTTLNPKAGNYSLRYPPQVQSPINHSNDPLAGTKWNQTPGYWDNNNKVSWCDYCHNNKMHAMSTLGKLNFFKGNNTVNSTIGNTSWCASCHWQGYSNGSNNYADMVQTFLGSFLPVPPEITGHSIYGANQSNPDYFNHSGFDMNDSSCNGCHGGLASATKITALTHNIDKGKGGTDCIGCHTDKMGNYPGINISRFTKHKNVNATGNENNLTNDDCRTCHYDTSDMKNVKTYSCENCHTLGNYTAPIINNHRTNGVNISTIEYCSSCHNNSINMFAYNANASSGHYITNISLVDSTNCITCHKNSTNAAKWGGATDPWNSQALPHTINSSTKEDCYACHANVSATTFHNISLKKPLNTAVKCIDCHTTNRTMAPKMIDEGVFKTGVHFNRSCTDCHANATNFNMNNTYRFANDSARNCTNCHIAPVQFGAPAVAEHNQFGQDVRTSANCTLCHKNAGMFITNAGTNGSSSAITHYIKDVTNRSTNPYLHNGPINTSNCITCHNNATYSGNASWGTPVNISTSSKRVHTETFTSQCDGCHNDGNVASLASVDFHNASVKLAEMDNCLGCHTSGQPLDNPTKYPAISNTSFGRHRNVNTTEGGSNNLTNGDCKTCHYNTTNMSAVLTRTCENCHTGSGVPNATLINNHRNNNSVNITVNAQCSSCHNNSISMFKYSANASSGHYNTNDSLIDTANCITCHKNSTNGTKWGGAIDPWDSLAFSHTINGSTKEDCYACHANVSAATFHNISLQKPLNTTVKCIDCHTTNRTMAPKMIDEGVFKTGVHFNRSCTDCHANATNFNMNNTYTFANDSAKNCSMCHTGSGQYNAPIVAEHNEFGQQIRISALCTLCHSNGGMYLINSGTNGTGTAITHYIKDVTNLSILPYQHYGTINTSNCIDCHNGQYTNDSSWGSPVNISTSSKRQHTETLTSQCDDCHSDGNVPSLGVVDFHNASFQPASTENCLGCHRSSKGPNATYTAINTSLFGNHSNVNKTGGNYTITNDDCTTCHFNFNYSVMNQPGNTTPARECIYCHTNGNYNAKIISNHRPGGAKINTTAYCTSCHNNSVNMYTFNQNASGGHYGTTNNLVKPTAGTYNTACNICHNSATNKTLYGVGNKQITMGHTSAATCDECHVNSTGSADTLHNVSLEMPVTTNCQACHTTYADKYGAPNLIGLPKAGWSTCNGGSCHTTLISDSLDTLERHNLNLTYPSGKGGSTGTVSLNPYVVTKGASVNITSNVNDSYSGSIASKVGGAEYYIDIDPGQGKGIPMAAADGNYNAINGAFENVVATLDTSNLPGGNHTIFVRGVDIGRQWSATMNATLLVQAFGYINGTVTNETGALVFGVYVSTTVDNDITGSDGKYSLWVSDGNHTVNASKLPQFYNYTISDVNVIPLNTTTVNIVMDQKPIGTISGLVRNV